MPILACGGCIKDLFVTEEELVERFTGKELWLWGVGTAGELGTNDIVNRSSPVQTVSGGTNWRSVSIGGIHSAAIKTDGSLWIWGNSAFGVLGTNDTVNRSSPVQTISGGTNWRSVSAGDLHSAAIKTDGTLWLWGRGTDGILGDNTIVNKSSPVQTASGGNNWRSISSGTRVTAAIKTDGTLWLWGSGSNGLLGDNTVISKSSPVQTISGGTSWRSVSIGSNHSAAIKTDGTLWMWGTGTNGVLGTNDTTNRSSPTQTVSSGTNWRSVSIGETHSAAIKTDGTLWIWGRGLSGRLGDNDIINRSSPVQTVSGGTDWRSVSLGSAHSSAIKTDGTLWLWGFGASGRLGDNTIVDKSSPVQTISGGTNWRSVSIRGYSAATCVIE